MKKSDYLKTLKELSAPASDDAAPDAEPVVSGPSVVERTAAPVVEKPAAPEPAAPVAAAPAAPAEPELFPGYSALPEDRRKEIAERWRLADEAKAKAEEAERLRREFSASQNRLVPTQQQVRQQQLEIARLQQQVNAFNDSSAKTANADLRKRIEDMRAQFPDDAAMWSATLSEAEAAKSAAARLEEKLQRLEQRADMNEQVRELTEAHPDWRKKTARVVQTEQGYAVQRTVDTPEAHEMEVWANALDPHERNMIWPLLSSQKASDAVYVLNRFEQDRTLARQLVQAQAGATQDSPTAPAHVAAPVADPDPTRRTTAPAAQRPAGQPMSDKKRDLIAATDLLRKQGKIPPAAQHRRA
jgi:hypothetical protein